MKKMISLIIFYFIIFNLYSQNTIQRAQAMFIYNFTRLIEFPAETKTNDFVIGVYGSKDAYSEINSYSNGKNVGSQTIVVKNFNSVEEITKCQVLFVSFSKTKELTTILSKISSGTLIITEKNGAINDGSAINFVIIDDKLKFEVNPNNAEKFKIKLSSKITEMAYKLIT